MIARVLRRGQHRLACRQLARCLRHQTPGPFLGVLLRALALGVQVDQRLGRGVVDFIARYHLTTGDGKVDLGLTFRDGLIEVRREPRGTFDATLHFVDESALMCHFAAEHTPAFHPAPVIGGNLNYVYRLEYLARRVQLNVLGAHWRTS